jgi:ABC-type transporter Mla subunit MlaD
MLLRICLILTIVAGLGTAYLGFVPVKEIIQTTRDARNDYNSKWKAETALYQKTDKELKKTKTDLASTTAQLNDTKNQLDTATTKIAQLDKQNTDLTDKLAKQTARADANDQELEKWRILDLTPEQVKGMMDDLKKTKTAMSGVTAENKVLNDRLKDLESRYFALVGTNEFVELPQGLKGTVLAVDPKYGFVVLNIGDDQGVKERGEMMVNRKGQLIGKVRITSVDKDRSIASILPAWKRGEVMEGDQVLY